MIHVPVTLSTAGVLGIIYIALSVFVIRRRRAARVSLGDGGDAELLSRVRAHANFSEYVPIVLILLGFYEASGGDGRFLSGVAIVFVLARVSHVVGIVRPTKTFFYRILGMAGTFTSLGVLSIAGVLRGLGL